MGGATVTQGMASKGGGIRKAEDHWSEGSLSPVTLSCFHSPGSITEVIVIPMQMAPCTWVRIQPMQNQCFSFGTNGARWESGVLTSTFKRYRCNLFHRVPEQQKTELVLSDKVNVLNVPRDRADGGGGEGPESVSLPGSGPF